MKRQANGPDPPHGAPGPATDAALPRLLSGKRRALIAGLAFTGLGLAACSAATTFLMAWMLGAGRSNLVPALAGLAVALLGIGCLRVLERVLAEKLGQDYVQQIRENLVRESLAVGSRSPLGITIARTTNDLSNIRNWITLGLAPVTVAVPVIAGIGTALWLLSPPLAAAGMVPLGFLAVVLFLLSGPALSKAREVRRRRGRLANRIADTVTAAASIQAAGGTRREVRRIARLGDQLAAAAVQQARTSGCLRASAAVASSASVAAVAGAGAWLTADTAVIAAALTAAGMLSAPVTETGRIVEYRQKFLAARAIIAPLMATTADRTQPLSQQDTPRPKEGSDPAGTQVGKGTVQITGLVLGDGTIVPALRARAGERIVIHSKDPDRSTEVCRTVLGLLPGLTASVIVDGRDLLATSPLRRRRLAGFAARGAILEPGTISRVLRYRRPDLPPRATEEMFDRVGLTKCLASLESGVFTRLRRGGEPLNRSDLARLQLARALLGDPPLLVLDHIDSDLGRNGSTVTGQILAPYPGVVLIASETPEALPGNLRTWDIDLPAQHDAAR